MLKRLPLLIAVLLLAVWAGQFIIKNFLAVALIAYGREEASRTAAVAYSPQNAEVLAARGRYLLYRAEPPQLDEAISLLRQAALNSPRDYRFWFEVSKAYEADGRTAQAETALRRAVELAPRYFETRWALANLYMRTASTESALNEFREAIALSGTLSGNITPIPDRNVALIAYNTVAGVLGMNLAALHQVTPSDNAARAYLAEFLATRTALDEALNVWRDLPANATPPYRNLVFQLLRELQRNNRFSDARAVWTKWASAEGAPTDAPNNLIANAGFERQSLGETYFELADPPSSFDWIIRRHPEVRISRRNDAAHTGTHALHLHFAAAMSGEVQPATQLIAVEPGQKYRLSYYAKTRNVSPVPTETLFVEITDAHNPAAFALRSVVPTGTTDWSEQAIVFTTLPDTHGLRITIHCPQIRAIDLARTTEIWLDDFKMEREN
jgi:tetratricopeptide (TPR) repeat protein